MKIIIFTYIFIEVNSILSNDLYLENKNGYKKIIQIYQKQ